MINLLDPVMRETVLPLDIEFSNGDSSGTASSTVDLPFTGDGGYSFSAECSDHAGNIGVSGATTLAADTTPPRAVVSSPANGSVFLSNQTLTIAAEASDALSGVATTSTTLDGKRVGNGSAIDLRTLALGKHTVETVVSDLAGNKAAAKSVFEVRPIPAVIDINPDTLNLKSKGQFVTAYIEIPGQDLGLVGIGTVRLVLAGGAVAAESSPAAIGDHNHNDVPDLMVKFSRSAVATGMFPGNVAVQVLGLVDGAAFEGTDTLRVL